MIFTLVTGILFAGYALLILAITNGWRRLKVFNVPDLLPEVKVSIIVAVRNEESNIEALLKSLSTQKYPSHLLEIIVVDDHSSDSTSRLIEDSITTMKLQNLRWIKLDLNDGSGKKAAIQKGIQASGGELIVITDADCTSGSLWISTLAAYYNLHHPQMILGPVCMKDNGSLFGKLQSIEFMSLISTAAGSCNAGFPLLGNGANIAFTRHAYESCGGFSGNMQFPSGDDMFLLMSIKRKFGAKAIQFLRAEEALVITPAITEIKAFIQQRLRWVSKSRGYTDPTLITASVWVFLTNAWFVIIAFAAIFSQQNLQLFLLFYFLKMLLDLPLMISYSRFQRNISLLRLFPLLELLNAFYTLIIGISGNIGKYEWKGRQVANKRKESR